MRQQQRSRSPLAAQTDVGHIRSHKLAQPNIQLRSDKRVNEFCRTSDLDWISIAQAGVERKLIERDGGEVARATTVVRFAPGGCFPEHTHTGGEEFVVLSGSWNDCWGKQPALTYVRNYIGSKHSPQIGDEGVVIMVKLRQMSNQHCEPEHMQVDFSEQAPWPVAKDGVAELLLYASPHERVLAQHWASGVTAASLVPANGQEVFVVDGSFEDELGEHDRWAWARYAETGKRLMWTAGPQGCLLWIKQGHLHSPEVGNEELVA